MTTIPNRITTTLSLLATLAAVATATATPPSSRKGIVVWDNTAFGLAATPPAWRLGLGFALQAVGLAGLAQGAPTLQAAESARARAVAMQGRGDCNSTVNVLAAQNCLCYFRCNQQCF